MRKRKNPTDPIKFLCLFIPTAFTFILFISILKIHEPNGTIRSREGEKTVIGTLGESVIGMLPDDLGFTLFLPSEKALLNLRRRSLNGSSPPNEDGDTHAMLTRVLGFAAVPRMIYWEDVGDGEEIRYDSISGFALFAGKDAKGRLWVNGVRSEPVDLRRGKIVVHVMDGVLMDAEFQLSTLEV
ncbi:hypothetical protein DM860_010784 [Cuscuta australis]|uniref:FAS1 domain-containing protein n=1 Tax=Cuscuta australis TaxID=267555 RepID=A0A328DZY1_9ASTE|nr:hypothetical protein DM860_010784 [Cuscuta australis]